MLTVVIDLDKCHCVTIAFLGGIEAVLIDAALTGVLIVVGVASGPKVALNSVTVVPPRLLNAAEFKRGAKTVVLQAARKIIVMMNIIIIIICQ